MRRMATSTSSWANMPVLMKGEVMSTRPVCSGESAYIFAMKILTLPCSS